MLFFLITWAIYAKAESVYLIGTSGVSIISQVCDTLCYVTEQLTVSKVEHTRCPIEMQEVLHLIFRTSFF